MRIVASQECTHNKFYEGLHDDFSRIKGLNIRLLGFLGFNRPLSQRAGLFRMYRRKRFNEASGRITWSQNPRCQIEMPAAPLHALTRCVAADLNEPTTDARESGRGPLGRHDPSVPRGRGDVRRGGSPLRRGVISPSIVG